MEWKNLLTEERLLDEERPPSIFNKYPISSFERDYERIVSSSAFRRLQDKTQVFPLSKSDFVRTRLTHSVEVSTIAKQLGIMCFQKIGPNSCTLIDSDENKDDRLFIQRNGDVEAILLCAGLLHDIGNPPFGHVGERIIREWFKNNLKKIHSSEGSKQICVFDLLDYNQIKDLENFEGNAQAIRILLKANHQSEVNLPFSIISSMVKYPITSDELNDSNTHQKIGCFQAEKDVFMRISEGVGTLDSDGKIYRHPLSYLVEAADDIAYMTADLEDAVKAKIVTVEELIKFFKEVDCKKSHHYDTDIQKLEKINEIEENKAKVIREWGIYLRRWLMYGTCWRFSESYHQIMTGEYKHDLFYDNYHTQTVQMIKKAMKKFVFNSTVITEPEISAQVILNFLLDKFVPAVVNYDGFGKMTIQDEKVITLISKNYIDDYLKLKNNIKDDQELLYRRILIATDFISGMTDGYAKSLYKRMSGMA